MTEPTDDELDAVIAKYQTRIYPQDMHPRFERAIMRAAIAKWGTPPAVAGEPVAWMGVHDNTDLYYRKPPQADVVPLYTTPQPTQAQAGAVPLTDEQIAEGFAKRSRHIGLFAGGVRFAEQHHGIKGGQHGAE